LGLSIIIIHYQTDLFTIKCLKSLIKYNDVDQYEIIVIDNASEKPFKLPDDLRNGKISLLSLEENLGYAGAANKGILHSVYDYFLVLNNDIEFLEFGLKDCLQQMENNSEIGALSCRLLYPDKSPQPVANRYNSIKKELIEFFRLQKFNKKGTWLLGGYFDHTTSLYCDWIWGTFFLSKKELLKDLPHGKLDDSFFLYFEDVVWCKQLQNLGKKIHYFADFSILHYHSKTVEQSIGNESKNLLMAENENSFFLQYYGKLYSFFLYFVRSLNFASHPSKKNLYLASKSFRRAIKQI
jgi:GT2 family glycosyltransferase